ncbi:MAG TPA: cyclic nucleotide-binding domain-containing protein [Acidimicrobiia bacterium]|jgi:CRP-like cAMP-binding protein
MFTPVTADDLAAIPLFAGLGRNNLDVIAHHTIKVLAREGIHLVRQGEPGFDFFIVLNGDANVLVDGQVVASLKTGDVFGEMALLGSHRRMADVVATSQMTLATMMVWDFRRLTADYPQVADRLMALVQTRQAED